MINARHLETMYQQWTQGRDDWPLAWVEFVALAARECNESEVDIIKELQKHCWFNWQPGT